MRLLVVATTLALVVSACGGSDADSTTAPTTDAATSAPVTTAATEATAYASDDGRLVVDAPAGTPVLSIAAADTSDLTTAEGFEVIAAYDVAADAALPGPVTITLDTGLDPTGGFSPVWAFVEGVDGVWELLPEATVEATEDAVTLTATVPHFSRLVTIADGSQIIDLAPASFFGPVGSEWEVIWSLRDNPAVFLSEDIQTERLSHRQTIITNLTAAASPLAGGIVMPLPGGNPITLPEAVEYFDTPWVTLAGQVGFRCIAPGAGSYGVEVLMATNSPAALGDVIPEELSSIWGVEQMRLVPGQGAQVTYRTTEGIAGCGGDEYKYYFEALALMGDWGVNRESLEYVIFRQLVDDLRDFVYSIAGVIVTRVSETGRIDIWDTFAFITALEQGLLDDLFNESVFECGETGEHGFTTVCAEDAADITGPVAIIGVAHHEDLPSGDAPDSYTYAAVFETDGDPANDWQFQGEFDWDFFQGTDRWYQLFWVPGTGWLLGVSDGTTLSPNSGARALIKGTTIVWVIPTAEIGMTPLFRVSAFVHDGTFAPEVSAGDVSGADPTEPLQPIPVLDQ